MGGSSNLAIMIAAHFPRPTGQDRTIRRTIKRYCRAAVSMIFHRYGQEHFSWDDLNLRGTLTSKEIAILKEQGSYPEAIWAWIGAYLTDIYKAKLLPEVVYQTCLENVAKGRGGAGLIGAQMGCQLPLTYVHAVNWMVKFTNVVCALSQGYSLSMHIFWPNTLTEGAKEITGTFGDADGSNVALTFAAKGPEMDETIWWMKHTWWVISSLGSVIIMTTLYNAMLIVAQQLSNPFNQDRLSFPGLYYEKGVEEDSTFFHNMVLNKPWGHIIRSEVEDELNRDSLSEPGGREGPASLQSLIKRMSQSDLPKPRFTRTRSNSSV